jgi:hypothetical protein
VTVNKSGCRAALLQVELAGAMQLHNSWSCFRVSSYACGNTAGGRAHWTVHYRTGSQTDAAGNWRIDDISGLRWQGRDSGHYAGYQFPGQVLYLHGAL